MACEGPAVLLHQTAAFSCGAPTVSCSSRICWLVDGISGQVGVADHIRQVVTTLPTQGGWVDARGRFTASPCFAENSKRMQEAMPHTKLYDEDYDGLYFCVFRMAPYGTKMHQVGQGVMRRCSKRGWMGQF